MATKITDKYEYAHNVSLNQEFTSPKTGIAKKFGKLTNEDVEALIKAGHKNFKAISKFAVKPTDSGK
jgi:hypothetical protein